MINLLRKSTTVFRSLLSGRGPYRGWTGLRLIIVRAAAWPIRYWKWRRHVVRMHPLSRITKEKTVCVLLSYDRPRNLQAILDSVVKCGIFDEIILSNNNPDYDMLKYLRDVPEACRIIQQVERRPCFERVEIAARSDGAFFFFADDDLYLYPEDIKNMMAALVADPSRPHGAFGKTFSTNGMSEETGACGKVCDILNRLYCITGEQAKRCLEIRDRLQLKFPELSDSIILAEDIIISNSGQKRAMLHKLNRFIPDPDGFDPNVSLWGRPGFRDLRMQVSEYLLSTQRSEGDIDA